MSHAPLSRRHAVAAVTLSGIAMLAAGCHEKTAAEKAPTTANSANPGTTPSPTASATPGEPATLTPADTDTSAAPAWAAPAAHLEAEASGDPGVEAALRTGVHEDYDRVVVQFSGAGKPGYLVDVVEDPSHMVKDQAVSLDGKYAIRVIGRGTHMPLSAEDQADAYQGPWDLAAGGAVVHQVVMDPTFEDQFQLLIGSDSQTYRVFTLSEPSRLVIDVKH